MIMSVKITKIEKTEIKGSKYIITVLDGDAVFTRTVDWKKKTITDRKKRARKGFYNPGVTGLFQMALANHIFKKDTQGVVTYTTSSDIGAWRLSFDGFNNILIPNRYGDGCFPVYIFKKECELCWLVDYISDYILSATGNLIKLHDSDVGALSNRVGDASDYIFLSNKIEVHRNSRVSRPFLLIKEND